PLTAAAVTLPQLMYLIGDTLLAALMPDDEQLGDPVAIDLDGRALRAQFIRQGSDVLLRIEPRTASQPPARPSQPPPGPPPPPARPGPAGRNGAADPGAQTLARIPSRTPPHGSAVVVPQIAVRPAPYDPVPIPPSPPAAGLLDPRDATRGGVNGPALPG